MSRDDVNSELIERDKLAKFFDWWSQDQWQMAYAKRDHNQHLEFCARAEALADAARAIRDGDDARAALPDPPNGG